MMPIDPNAPQIKLVDILVDFPNFSVMSWEIQLRVDDLYEVSAMYADNYIVGNTPKECFSKICQLSGIPVAMTEISNEIQEEIKEIKIDSRLNDEYEDRYDDDKWIHNVD